MSAWLDQVFDADAAEKTGGIVRRNKEDVSRYASLAELLEQVKERGYHLIETKDQYVVICKSGALKLHC